MRPVLIFALVACLGACSKPPATNPLVDRAQESGKPIFQTVIYYGSGKSQIALVSSDELEMRENGTNLICKYSIQDKRLRVVNGNVAFYFDITEEGLRDEKGGMYYTSEDEMQLRKGLSNAKQVGLACRLFGMDNNGAYPEKLSQLVPTYMQNLPEILTCPFTGEKDGYEYYSGLNDSSPITKILLKSRHTSSDGRRIIIYCDGSGQLVKE